MAINPTVLDHPDIGELLRLVWINGWLNRVNVKTIVGNDDKPTIEQHIAEILKLNGLRNPYVNKDG